MRRLAIRCLVWVAVCGLLSTPLQGFTLDWSNVTWGAGTLNNTFTDVDGSGLDVRVRITRDTGSLQTNFPQITNAFPIDDALDIFVDFSTRNERLHIFIEFFETGTTNWANVTNVQFDIYDVDTADGSAVDPPTSPIGFIDSIENVRGRTRVGGTGAWFGPTITAPNHVISGSGAGIDVRADASNGNLADNNAAAGVNFDYGSNVGSQYRAFYRNPNNATWVQDDPSQQAIGLGNITFVVPEAETYWALVILLIKGIWSQMRRRPTV